MNKKEKLVLRRATKKFLEKGAGSYQRWQQLYVNDMWQSDVSHGIWLRDPINPGKSKLQNLSFVHLTGSIQLMQNLVSFIVYNMQHTGGQK